MKTLGLPSLGKPGLIWSETATDIVVAPSAWQVCETIGDFGVRKAFGARVTGEPENA